MGIKSPCRLSLVGLSEKVGRDFLYPPSDVVSSGASRNPLLDDYMILYECKLAVYIRYIYIVSWQFDHTFEH